MKDNTIKEGGINNIMDTAYRFTLSRHDNPDLELTGHYWEIVEFAKVGELQKIVWLNKAY